MERNIVIKDEKYRLTVRRIEEQDTGAVSCLVCRNLREINSRDYGMEAMEEMCTSHDAGWVSYMASFSHMYVVLIGDTIVACGSVSSYWGDRDESMIQDIYVLPELQGRGLGRTVMETLEQDELYIRAKRVEVAASVSSCDFYRRFGYQFKKGINKTDRRGICRMEKFKTCKEAG